MIVDLFMRCCGRIFTPGTWHRVPFQPILFLLIWGAAMRIVVDESAPAPFQLELSNAGEAAWVSLIFVCPLLSAAAWWLMMRSKWRGAALAGLWIRLASDVGMLAAIVTFHVANSLNAARFGQQSDDFFSRYLAVSVMVYLLLAVSRDVWALVLTDRVARSLDRE